MLENKTIHYCWFGGSPLSATAVRDIESWKRFAPGYEIKQWDETNFDVDACAFASAAYKAGKWAFVSDYARYKILIEQGGVYFDVGTELIKPLQPLENRVPFSAVEYFSRTVSSGLVLAANAGDPLIQEVLDRYYDMEFRNDSDYLSSHTVNETMTNVFERHGYVRESREQTVGKWTILGPDVFGPVYGFGGFHIKNETISIHHYSGSWGDESSKFRSRVEMRLTPFVGRRIAQITSRAVAELRFRGFKEGMKKIFQLAKS